MHQISQIDYKECPPISEKNESCYSSFVKQQKNGLTFQNVLMILTSLGMIDIKTNVSNILKKQAEEIDYLWLFIHEDSNEEFANEQKLEMMTQAIALIINPEFIITND